MKKALPLLLLSMVVVVLASPSMLLAAYPTPVWEFNFNDVASGVYANNTGSDPNAANAYLTMMNTWSTPTDHRVADGPSGLASDMSFSSVPSGSAISYAVIPGDQCGGIGNWSTMTVSGWYKATVPVPMPDQYTRIFLIGNRHLWDEGMVIDFNNQNLGYNQIGMEVNDYYNRAGDGGGDAYAKVPDPNNGTGQWRFWAVTYDGVPTSNNVKIYMGTQAGAATLIGTGTMSHIPITVDPPLPPMNNPTGIIRNIDGDFVLSANSEWSYTGGFTGYQDNIRVWNGILNLSQIESARNGDLSHLASNPAGGNSLDCGKGHPTTANPNGALTLAGAATLSNDGFAGSTIAVTAANITGADASMFHISGIPATLTAGGAGQAFDVIFDGGTPGIYSASLSLVTEKGNVNYALSAKVLYQGDADENGSVTFADYQLLEAGFGTGTTWAQGNFDGVGVTTFSDYQRLEANFGKTATPEPATLCLLAMGGLALIRRR